MLMCRWARWAGRAVNHRSGSQPASHANQIRARLLPRSFALAAVAVAAVTAAAPAAATGRPVNMMGIDGKFGLVPAPSGHGRPSLYFQLTAPAGGSAGAAIIVANLGKTTETLKLGRALGITATNGGSTYRPLLGSCAGPGCWVMGLPRVVTLPAGAEERLKFTVRVPSLTSPGQYLGGISAGPDTAPQPVTLSSGKKASTKATIVQNVTIGVAVTVGRLSSLTTRFRIAGVLGSLEGSMDRLSIRLDNTGQTFAQATGTASCSAGGSQHSYAVHAATILPGEHAEIAVNAPGLPEGATLPCTVSLNYGNHQTVTWTGQVTMPGASNTHVIHTANGAYAVIPNGGVPPWAIALIGIGVLILAGIGGVLIRPVLARRPGRGTRAAAAGRNAGTGSVA
jgi:hypothetical protein